MHDVTVLSKTNLTFLLDGHHVGSFIHDPQNDNGTVFGFRYQVPVFSKDHLPYGQHALHIQPQLGSMVLLDFVQYSTLDTSGTGFVTPTPLVRATGSQKTRYAHGQSHFLSCRT